MTFEFHINGAEHKALVQAIGEILETKPKYMGMLSAAYDFGGLVIDRNGSAEFEENIFHKDIAELLQKLAERGFTAANAESEKVSEEVKESEHGADVGLTVVLPLDKVSVGNLTKLLDAKGGLIKKSIGD